jgi:tRNA pseudouridine55 synthase
MSDLNGFLLVDKPTGISSFGIVARVRGVIREETGHKIKIGHTGTLDPAASGLMILVLGSYTKRASGFSKLDKTYEAEITLGATSTTGDSEGFIESLGHTQNIPSHEKVGKVLEGFIGKGLQVPPIHSAIKIDGQRAYKLARQGKPVKIEPREVTIYGIKHIAYGYPSLKFTVSVSSGTYIRSLASDVGEKLATGAYLYNLRRILVNNFNVKDAISIAGITFETIQRNLRTENGVAKVL